MPAPGSPTARVMRCEAEIVALRQQTIASDARLEARITTLKTIYLDKANDLKMETKRQAETVGRVVKAAQRQSEIIQQLFGLINQQNEKIKKMEGIIDDLVESVGGIESYVQEQQGSEQYAKLGID